MLLGCSNIDEKAIEYCTEDYVAGVYVCGDMIQVVSDLNGGVSTYYREDGSRISCPVIGPDAESKECRKIFGLKAEGKMCEEVC